MAIQQDEKVENINEIFNRKNIDLIEPGNKELHNNKKNSESLIHQFKLIFENYSNLPKNETITILLNGAKSGHNQLKLWMIDSFKSKLGEKIPIEVRRDISRILMKSNDQTIRQKSIDFLNTPVKQFDKLVSNKNKEKNNNKLKTEQKHFSIKDDISLSTAYDLNNIDKKKELSPKYNIDIQLKEYILCLTLWMGGDGAIFNVSDISQYLPYKNQDIKKGLEELRKEKILGYADGNYVLLKRGSILADSVLLKIIAQWYNTSILVDRPGYSTIHYGFIKDKRNVALSNFTLSLRSFVTDYFQFILEKFVEYYSYKKISYFSNFRKILILIALNPTLNFLKEKRNEFNDVFSDFSESELIKIIDTKNGKLILIKDDFLMRRNKKG